MSTLLILFPFLQFYLSDQFCSNVLLGKVPYEYSTILLVGILEIFTRKQKKKKGKKVRIVVRIRYPSAVTPELLMV